MNGYGRRSRSVGAGRRRRRVVHRRSKTVGSGRRRHRRGRKMQGGSILSRVSDFLKKHKIISRGARALSGILPGTYGTIAGHVGSVADKVGYGPKRRRVVHRRRR